jgi:CS domain
MFTYHLSHRRQTLEDVSVIVPVPPGTRARDLTVEIRRNRLKVGLKGKEPIISGDLSKDIKEEDSTWTVGEPELDPTCNQVDYTDGLWRTEDQREVSLHLEKINQMSWWDCVIKGHPTIDTSKIQPENSKLSDLDGETRGMVEKMMVCYVSSFKSSIAY